VASNTGNWQYIAGIGNDFVPFRFFDIVKQGNTYDADTSYLQHYLPALKDVPVFKRYGFGHLSKDERAVYDIDYPAPIFSFYEGLNLMKKRYGE
jgi:deoxyribodipyrimidine photo-lyase